MSTIKKIVFFVFSTLVILLGLFVLYVKSNEDKIIAKAVKGINEYLTTEVYIQKVGFSILKNFPEIAIKFNDVHGLPDQEFKTKADTLFYFNEMWVNFNLFRLLRKDYTIRDVECENGKFYMKVRQDGSKNYIFWKNKQHVSGKKESAAIQINKIVFKDVLVIYHDQLKGLSTTTDLINSRWNVEIKKGNFHLKHSGTLDVKHFTKKNVRYISNSKIFAQLELEKKDAVLKIEKGQLKYLNLLFDIQGTYNLHPDNAIDIIIEGKDLDIDQILSSIPPELIPDISAYKGNGAIDFNLHLSGDIGKSKYPHVELAFDINKGSISKKFTKNKIDNLILSGHYSNGTRNLPVSAAIVLKKCYFTLGSGNIDCSGLIRNLKQPYFEGKLSAHVKLDEVFSFVEYPPVERIQGELVTSLLLSGRLPDKEISFSSLKSIKPEGSMKISGVELKLANKPWYYESMEGIIQLQDGLQFEKFKVVINQNDFLLEGRINNGWESLFDSTAIISGHTRVFSRRLNLDNFYDIEEPGNKNLPTDNKKLKIQFPENLDLQVDFDVEKFSFRRFQAHKVSGDIHYKPKVFNLRKMSFYTLSGKIDGGGIIAQNYHDDFEVKCYSSLSAIDISRMFYVFKNFGQSFITHTHIKGEIDGKVNLSANWSNDLKVNKESIEANADVVAKNGELMNFIPMLSLSKYIEVDELKHIYFNTLENNFFIEDEVITMPQMDIYSSAFNIKASGTHDFNNNIDYRIQLFLSEILARDSNIRKKEENEFGTVEDDGLGRTKLYFKILGNINDFDVSYDRTRAIKKLKTNIKKEKKELKNIFREEFGLKKKSSYIKEDDNDASKTGDDPSVKPEGTSSESKGKGFQIQWDDDGKIDQDTLKNYSF